MSRTTARPPAAAAAAAAASSSSVLRASGPEVGGGDDATTTKSPSEAVSASVAIVQVGALLLAALALVWGGVLRSWQAGRGQGDRDWRETELEAVGLDGRAVRPLQGDEREGEDEEDEDDDGERGPLLGPAACTVYGSTH